MSGTEMQRAKESAADIMRAKQAAGTTPDMPWFIDQDVPTTCGRSVSLTCSLLHDSRGEKGRGCKEIDASPYGTSPLTDDNLYHPPPERLFSERALPTDI